MLCPNCMHVGVTRGIFYTLFIAILGVLCYFLLPYDMPGDSAFVLLVFAPFLVGGAFVWHRIIWNGARDF